MVMIMCIINEGQCWWYYRGIEVDEANKSSLRLYCSMINDNEFNIDVDPI